MKVKVKIIVTVCLLILIVIFFFSGNVGAAVIDSRSSSRSSSHIVKIKNAKTTEKKPINIEKGKDNENEIFYYRYPGRNPFAKSLKEAISKVDIALNLLGYTEKEATALKEEILAQKFEPGFIKNGDRFAMVFNKKGIDIVKRNTIADYQGKQVHWATVYKTVVDGKQLNLVLPLDCYNWSRYPEVAITAVPEPVPEPKKPHVTEKKPEEKIVEQIKIIKPTRIEDVETSRVEKIVKKEKFKCREIELNTGTGLLFGGEMKDHWYYSEGIYWDTCWEWGRGIGFYLDGDNGKVDSGYRWDSFGIGPQFGLRYLDYAKNEDGVVNPYGITAKLRLVWSKVNGGNSSSEYGMSQRDLLVGLYLEYVRQINDGLHWGITFEAWLSVWSKIDSTWVGDTPSDRARVFLGFFLQKRLNDDFSVKVGAGVGYQAWDEKYLIGVFGELRYREWLMCGVAANFIIEEGVVWGPYCRVELGTLIRSEREKAIIRQIIAIDEKGNPLEPYEPDEKSVETKKQFSEAVSLESASQ